MEKRKHERALYFMVLPGSSATPSARCTVCKRRFELQPKPGERADDIILRMREDFAAHNCNETPRDKDKEQP
ncbi:MAG: hypothetical protein WA651_07070 [Candidatus Sulfotelmatobacter sp.]